VSEPNDRLLDEYLRGESPVSQRYRDLDADEVPPRRDAAVLAQARAAVESRRGRKPAWRKWGAPLALAASAVMAVAIVLEIGVQDEVRAPSPRLEQSTSMERPQETATLQRSQVDLPAPVADAPPALAEPDEARKQAVQVQAVRERGSAAMRSSAPPASTEREAIEAITMSGAEVPADTDAVSADAVDSPPPAATVAMAPPPVTAQRTAATLRSAPPAPPPSSAALRAPRLEPEVWLERIRELRREDKVLEADEQWREFVAAYPDYDVDAQDVARPRS